MLASYLLPPEYRLEDAVRDQLHMISIQEKLDLQPYFFIRLRYYALSISARGKRLKEGDSACGAWRNTRRKNRGSIKSAQYSSGSS